MRLENGEPLPWVLFSMALLSSIPLTFFPSAESGLVLGIQSFLSQRGQKKKYSSLRNHERRFGALSETGAGTHPQQSRWSGPPCKYLWAQGRASELPAMNSGQAAAFGPTLPLCSTALGWSVPPFWSLACFQTSNRSLCPGRRHRPALAQA